MMKAPFISILIFLIIFGLNCGTSSEAVGDNTVSEGVTVEEPVFDPVADSLAQIEAEEQELREALIELYKDEVYSRYQSQANTLTNYYILAQQHFYSGDFQNALFLVNRAALIKENADVLALRGSIYLGLGYINEFVNQWRRALEMDPDVPIPSSTYIIQQLQNNGLIDQNLKKAF